ncbi:DoxX family protein [Corynebacterium silvaticum]|uniref:DoxX family membrane protein n=1 Tax=Corynebacterium silvaticum TaxID=2320431 RepID=A0A7Y4LIX2_9CORY|nr:DoxX family protein [Corynebacterium silvaticum]ARU46010.1 DoxX family membrane protein [Corynebacterium silvaticum]MBH5300570.1 DoxX family membrane protein [Corynebacterium silvaticum]NOM64770.1 DoxX family membrane protein [Corynebacterium silvaticum]NON69743.1 DoxX family membrane protein [Corynebacterium silvaticum]TFA93405.1 DoxX family membrane protein [Corynebacterium silvaticum]
MNDNAKPDRASDLDDEIPTYQAPSASSPREESPEAPQEPSQKTVDPAKSLYERAGRVAPQSIQPSARSNAAPEPASVQPPHVESPAEKKERVDATSHKESIPEAVSDSPRVEPTRVTEKVVADEPTTVSQKPLASKTDATDVKPAVAPEVVSQAKVQHPPTDSFSTETVAKQPAPAEDKTTVFSAAPAAPAAAAASVARPVTPKTPGEEKTTTLGRDTQRHSQPLASDAPTSIYRDPAPTERAAYRDEDFAPAVPPVPPAQPAPSTSPVVTPAPVSAPATTAFAESPVEQAPAVAPAAPQPEPVDAHAVAVAAKRGTIDFGLLVLRVVFGAWLILDAVQVFFAMGNSGGINGLQDQFSSYAYASTLAVAVPAMELAAGVFLVFGLLTPVAAAVATVVTSFLTVHHIASADSLNLIGLNNSIWFAFFLTTISLVLQFTGPGLISFDVSRSWAKRPLASSWVFAVLGIAGAVALWWFGAAVNPLV